MANAGMEAPCLVFALPVESHHFRRRCQRVEKQKNSPVNAYLCELNRQSILVLHSGVGIGNMQRTMEWLFAAPVVENQQFQPTMVFSCGFAGGLQPNLEVGTVVWAKDIINSSNERWRTTVPQPEKTIPDLFYGDLLTCKKLIGTASEKALLHEQSRATVVDMESVAMAKICHQRHMPFCALRVISDDAHTNLSPRLLQLLGPNGVSIPAVLAGIVRRPILIVELLRLARHSRIAGKNLALVLESILATF